MTETRRQHDLSVTETVEASSVAAGITPGLPPDDPLHAGGETRSQWRDVWRQFRSHRGAMVALVLFVSTILFVLVGPYLWTIDPTYVDIRARNSGFSVAHPLGTDQLGRDLLARLMAGGHGGAVVNVSSIAGLRMGAARVHSAYSASKAGIIGFSKSVAMAYAARGIRCNTVVPGLMHTPLVEHRLVRQLGANDAEALIAKRNAAVPIGRMGTAWDVAHAALFLLSDEAGHITGTELVVDGGISAAGPV